MKSESDKVELSERTELLKKQSTKQHEALTKFSCFVCPSCLFVDQNYLVPLLTSLNHFSPMTSMN